METNQLQVEIVTPEGRLLCVNAEQVEYPCEEGELGILPGHVPLLTDLAAGELRIFHPQELYRFAVAGGYVQVHPTSVRIVATFASPGEDEARIDAACERAKEALELSSQENPAVIEAELFTLRHEFSRLKPTRPRTKS
jgi:F-type H+-transporting ATPase subunit epsilon